MACLNSQSVSLRLSVFIREVKCGNVDVRETLSQRNSCGRTWCNTQQWERTGMVEPTDRQKQWQRNCPFESLCVLEFRYEIAYRPSSKVTRVSCVKCVCAPDYIGAVFCMILSFRTSGTLSLPPSSHPFFRSRSNEHTNAASSALDKLYVVCYARRL